MRSTVAWILIALLLAGSVGLALPAGAQSHGSGHHVTIRHHAKSGQRGTAGHHGHVRAQHHRHRSTLHHHVHARSWWRSPAIRCDQLGWRT